MTSFPRGSAASGSGAPRPAVPSRPRDQRPGRPGRSADPGSPAAEAPCSLRGLLFLASAFLSQKPRVHWFASVPAEPLPCHFQIQAFFPPEPTWVPAGTPPAPRTCGPSALVLPDIRKPGPFFCFFGFFLEITDPRTIQRSESTDNWQS